MYRSGSLMLYIFVCLSPNIFAQITYVSPAGTGNGTSWADASGDLKAVLDASTYGTEIWLAEGVYYPTTCTTCTNANRNVAFVIPDGVRLYGGFAGDETSLNQRDWKNHESILSADIDRDGTAANNAFTIIYTEFISEQTIVDGLIISDANADDLTVSYGSRNNSGGGWFNLGIASGHRSNPTIRNCTFKNNHAEGFGGALYNEGGFSGTANPSLINCTIQDNTAVKGGGGIYNNGVFSGTSSPVLISCLLTGNYTDNSGGALYNNGLDGVSNTIITNCMFYDNEVAMYGAGMYNLGKSGQASPIITNCNFCSNKAVAAGAIYNLGSEYGESSPSVTNCTFFENEANVGACIYNQAGDSTGTCEAVVKNSIFWGNIAPYGEVFQNGHGSPSISHCLIQVSDCSDLNTGINSAVNCGDGLIFNQDPMFMDPTTNNLHLQDLSPVIDLGDNEAIMSTGITVDLDSLIRVYNNVVDMGAYEYRTDLYIAPAIVNQPVDQEDCAGADFSFEVLLSGTRPLSYQWQKDGIDILNAQDSMLTINGATLADNGNYHCVIISGRMDTVISNTATLQTNENLLPMLNLSASVDEICSNEWLTFTAEATHAGDNPQYEWFLNGNALGINSLTYSTNQLSSDDKVSCRLISSETCLQQNPINSTELSVSVQANVSPAIQIAASAENICEGTTVVFGQNFEHGGSAPSVEWLLNGVAVGTSASYTSNNLQDGDKIVCILNSNAECADANIVQSNEIVMTVNPVLNPAISIEASALEICAGELINFQSSIAEAGANATYEWQLNGENLGTLASFSSSALADGDTVLCILRTTETCASQNIITSNEIVLTVNPILEPSIVIEASALDICAGDAVDFTSLIAEAGAGATYEWQVNGLAIDETTETWLAANLEDGDVIRCLLRTTAPCATQSMLESNELTITVNDILQPAILIDPSTTISCEGETVTFAAITQEAGTNASFQWRLNDNIVGDNTDIWMTSELQEGDSISCTLFTTAACAAASSVVAEPVYMVIHPVIHPTLSVTASATEICAGETVYFEALVEAAGDNFSFEWEINGMIAGTDQADFAVANLKDGDAVRCRLSVDALCTEPPVLLSDEILITVFPQRLPSIEISASAIDICMGETVQFEAFAEQAGDSIDYQWLVNGLPVGIDSLHFESNTLQDGDTIACILHTTIACADQSEVRSNSVVLNVFPVLNPSIEISASAMDICVGDSLVFQANGSQAGNDPLYEWLLNGEIVGTNSAEWSSIDLVNGDIVQCILTSFSACAVTNQVSSNELEITVNSFLESQLNIVASATNICIGDTVIFEAIPTNGGPAPVYAWELNGMVLGTDSTLLLITTLENQDEIQCRMLSSETCVTDSLVSSEIIAMTVENCLVGIAHVASDIDVKLFPNPSSDLVQLSLENIQESFELTVRNISGQLIWRMHQKSVSPIENILLDFADQAAGVYIVQISGQNFNREEKLIICK